MQIRQLRNSTTLFGFFPRDRHIRSTNKYFREYKDDA